MGGHFITEIWRPRSPWSLIIFRCPSREASCWGDSTLLSMDWFCWENLHRKPAIFPYHGVFRLQFPNKTNPLVLFVDEISTLVIGLAIVHQVWELIDKIERENRLQSRTTLPIMVVIGWAGNDVHGDFGTKDVHGSMPPT